jgi:hypothetical protein
MEERPASTKLRPKLIRVVKIPICNKPTVNIIGKSFLVGIFSFLNIPRTINTVTQLIPNRIAACQMAGIYCIAILFMGILMPQSKMTKRNIKYVFRELELIVTLCLVGAVTIAVAN